MQSRVHGHDARGNGDTGVRISYAFRALLFDLDMEVGTALVIGVSSITIAIAIANAAETIANAIKEKK